MNTVADRITRAHARAYSEQYPTPRRAPDPPYDLDVMLRTIRELSARVNELEGNNLDSGDADSFIARLPLGMAYVPVEYGFTEPDDTSDGGEVELLGVYVGGYWVEPDQFSAALREEWIEQIEAGVAERRADMEGDE